MVAPGCLEDRQRKTAPWPRASRWLVFLEPNPDEHRQIAEWNGFGVEDRRDRQLWAPMAVSDGFLLPRSRQELNCVQLPTRSFP
jgi:hypothetical protein